MTQSCASQKTPAHVGLSLTAVRCLRHDVDGLLEQGNSGKVEPQLRLGGHDQVPVIGRAQVGQGSRQIGRHSGIVQAEDVSRDDPGLRCAWLDSRRPCAGPDRTAVGPPPVAGASRRQDRAGVDGSWSPETSSRETAPAPSDSPRRAEGAEHRPERDEVHATSMPTAPSSA